MPKEINPVVTNALVYFLFVTEEDAVRNLKREGLPTERIYLVGNVMIDALRLFLPLAKQSQIGRELGLQNGGGFGPFARPTLHPPSNVDLIGTPRRALPADAPLR